MKILWVISQILPEIAEEFNIKKSNFGGWVRSMLQELKNVEDIQLSVVSCSDKVNSIFTFQKDTINYYVLPIVGKNRDVSDKDCLYIVDEVKPDIIHIEGTEFSISKRFSAIKSIPNLISMQGIINAYEPYQYGDLPVVDFMFSCSLTKLITGWTLFFRKRLLFNSRLEIERETISNADNIMGRTLWDRAHSYVFNKNARYFSCSRTLRKSFYNKKWEYENCKKHSIFVGNGYSALKGGHTAIKAVEQLVEEYPDVSLVIAGEDPYIHGKSDKKKFIGYSYYVRRLLKNTVLKERVHFIGSQPEEEMANNLLESNVYVLTSIIENSPNTLGEAMIMGVPCVSAYTGGAAEMAIDEKEALFYRAGDAEMLAWQIKRIFDMKDKVADMCEAARAHAHITHDPDKNLEDLLTAYRAILEGGIR